MRIHENVQQVAQLMRKRPKTDAAEQLYRAVKQKLETSPTLIVHALLNE